MIDITKILSNIKEVKGRTVYSLDIETGGLLAHEHKIEVITIKKNGFKDIEFVHVNKLRKEGKDIEFFNNLRNKLKNQAVIGHNLAFDMGFLKYYGIDAIEDNIYLLDTFIASKVDRGIDNMVSEMIKYPHMQDKHYTPLYKQKHNLGVVSWLYLKLEVDKELQRSDWTKEELTEDQIRYAKTDVKYLTKIYAKQYKSIKEKDLLNVLKLEEATLPAIINLNYNTIAVNKEKGHELLVTLSEDIKKVVKEYNTIVTNKILEKFKTLEDFENLYILEKWNKYNTTSKTKKKTKEINYKNAEKRKIQRGSFYSKDFNIFIPKEKDVFKFFFSKVYNIDLKSSDKEAIEKLVKSKNELALLIPNLTAKVKEFFDIDKAIMFLKRDNKIITQFNQMGTITGRLSSSGIGQGKNKIGINMQQINKDPLFRDIFEAGEGRTLVLADYSGMELRIIAGVTKEENMLKAFRDNISLHSAAAANIHNIPLNKFQKAIDDKNDINHDKYYNWRSVAKTMNFAIAYGAGATTISEKAGISIMQAEQAKKDYLKNNKNIAKYIKNQKGKVYVQSLIGRKMNVQTIIGSKEYYSIKSEWKKRQCKRVGTKKLWVKEGYSQNFNFPIQSTGADITKLALVFVINHEDFIKDKVNLALQVHDEIAEDVIISLAEKWKVILQDCMELAGNIIMEGSVKMIADANIGKTWNIAK